MLIGGVLGLVHGAASDAALQTAAGIVVSTASVAWAVWKWIADGIHAHATAQINADRSAGAVPVQPPRAPLAS